MSRHHHHHLKSEYRSSFSSIVATGFVGSATINRPGLMQGGKGGFRTPGNLWRSCLFSDFLK